MAGKEVTMSDYCVLQLMFIEISFGFCFVSPGRGLPDG